MTPLRFSFVLHVHQPVGNFDFVFREHANDVYRPFLDFLEERALWPIGLHVSGPLLEWLGEHDAALHDRIGRLAADGKAELLSAGWYEPVLAALDPADRATQLGWMREELHARFGVTPRGLWLTERVWSPELAADLADAGIGWALVDDHLLLRAGATEAELLRPVRAEHAGRSIDLLAIDEPLRYLIPFAPAEQVADELRRRHRAGDALALFADDGEKFGGWPRTREWLYDRGWLRAFGARMDELRAEEVVRMVTPSAALDELGGGRVLQVPEGSYPEMDGWAGGPWTRFLDRYEEAGRLHDWAGLLSAACRERGDPAELRRMVGRAQCNDAYWHGVFGGLCMKHLREGVRRWMARAEQALRTDRPLGWTATRGRDGARCHEVHAQRVRARVHPGAGGTLSELVWLEPHADVTDYLTRRLEAYHEEAVARGRGPGDAEPPADAEEPPADAAASIHQIEEAAVLERLPPVDADVRVLVRDRVLGPETAFEAYRDGAFEPTWSAGDIELPEPTAEPAASVESPHGALIWRFPATDGPFDKEIRIAEDRVELRWRWDALPAGGRFAPELSLGCEVELELDPEPDDVWRYPIVTLSKCPDGFEEIEQGTSLTPLWSTASGSARVVIRPRGTLLSRRS